MGCRLNAHDSEVIAEGLARQQTNDDLVIINSCAVTNEAVRQTRQTIRRSRRDKPNAKLVVTGCAAQIDPDSFAAMDEVDLVLGNEEKLNPASFLSIDHDEKVRVNDIMAVKETAGHMIDGFGSRARAYVQVQTGCDHRCTFCIIPYGRGNARSVPMGEVVQSIQKLVDQGYIEIVLTGVDITSYGPDLPGQPTLGKLVQSILSKVSGLKRLRLSSIDQTEIDEALLDAIKSDDRMMPHLHLSLQAGDNMILKRMKRRHAREEAIAFCDTIRAARRDMVFGADLIAGFPTESEAMFENSLKLVDDCGLTFLHVFPYSAREGTPAARMPQLKGDVIKDRAARLRAKGDAALQKHLNGLTGQQIDVLVEQPESGHAADFTPVRLTAPGPSGQIIKAQITGHDGKTAIADPV